MWEIRINIGDKTLHDRLYQFMKWSLQLTDFEREMGVFDEWVKDTKRSITVHILKAGTLTNILSELSKYEYGEEIWSVKIQRLEVM